MLSPVRESSVFFTLQNRGVFTLCDLFYIKEMRGAQVSRVFTETLGTLEMHAVPAHQGYQEYLGRMVSVGFQIFPFVIINVKIRINHTINALLL